MQARFIYHALEELEEDVARRGLDIRFDRDLGPLRQVVVLHGVRLPNSLGIHPLEGFDGTEDGKPGDLTFRRYRRFARGGAGLIWFGSTSVTPEGRANPRQLLASDANAASLAALREVVAKAAREVYGPDHEPYCVLQLTHSGRYSFPGGRSRPVIAHHNPVLDQKMGIVPEYPVVSDDELERLEDEYLKAARVAVQAGFEAVDAKACHGYLVSELLGSHLRQGRYGGSFENRTRFLLNVIDKIRADLGNRIAVAVRLNLWDGLPYPYGWGVNPETGRIDLTEPHRLLGELSQRGVCLIGLSLTSPYHLPQLNRPGDVPSPAGAASDDHPLQVVECLFTLTREIQTAHPELTVAGLGYSWLRQYLGNAAAANLRQRTQRIVAVGRTALAYPDFARDLLENGRLDPAKVCLACSKCTEIMRHGQPCGCVVRDDRTYLPIYREYCRMAQ